MPLPLQFPFPLGYTGPAPDPSSSLNDTGLAPGTGTALDLLLGEDGDVAFLDGDMVLGSGVEATMQEIRMRCRFFRGESFVDITAGVGPEEVFSKPPNIPAAQAAFRREIMATTDVASVEEVKAEFFPEERRLALSYRATRVDGTVLTDTFSAGV